MTARSAPGVPLARGVRVWVPPGEWRFLHSGASHRGPAVMVASFALDEVPVLVR